MYVCSSGFDAVRGISELGEITVAGVKASVVTSYFSSKAGDQMVNIARLREMTFMRLCKLGSTLNGKHA